MNKEKMPRRNGNLRPKYRGHFEIIQRVGDISYELVTTNII